MRVIPAIAAALAALFKPRKKVARVELAAPAETLPGPGPNFRELRRRRRAQIMRSYTRGRLRAATRKRYVERFAIGGTADERRLMRNARKKERAR